MWCLQIFDTYLKVFNQNILESKVKPKNLDTLTSRLELDLNHEDYDLTTGFVAFEDLQKSKSDRYEFALPYYIFSKDIWTENNIGSLNFSSSGDNILKDTNNLRSRIINDFDFNSFNFINQKGIKNNFTVFIKNLITSAKNDPEYSSKVENELMGIAELQSSLPMVKTEDKFINYTFTEGEGNEEQLSEMSFKGINKGDSSKNMIDDSMSENDIILQCCEPEGTVITVKGEVDSSIGRFTNMEGFINGNKNICIIEGVGNMGDDEKICDNIHNELAEEFGLVKGQIILGCNKTENNTYQLDIKIIPTEMNPITETDINKKIKDGIDLPSVGVMREVKIANNQKRERETNKIKYIFIVVILLLVVIIGISGIAFF